MKFLLSVLLLFSGFSFVNAQCNASFTWDDTDITIQFMDLSTSDSGDPITSWLWDFDDNGNTSSEQNPTYTFSDPAKYDVLLTITTQNGCTSSIEIQIETCVLDVSYVVGDCNTSGIIPVDLTINDPWDVAGEVDVILDGQSVPGSPFMIDAATPVSITVDVPGDGLEHTIQCQSIDIATCGKSIEFSVPDCSSDCFLSGLQVGYPTGVTHTVDVGDDFFSPVSTGIVLGDVVNFNWIGDGHSTTSDATSGVDSWNSGVISIGSSFDVFIENPGVHPYYCIPHGGPGGAGMSGEILANCPGGNTIDIEINFSTTVADAAGFNIYYDGALVPGSPFSYNGVGNQTVTISIAGDGMIHPLLIEDVSVPSCTLSLDYNAPDCNQGGGDPVCSISISLGAPSGCDANQNVTVTANVSIVNGGSGCNLSIDGGNPTYYAYNGPNTTIDLTLPGDGLSHTVDVMDDADVTCTASSQITTPDCNLPCNITNLTATAGGSGGNGIIHTVNVEDFIFNPSIVNITVGDQVEWVWTGNVAHTATSDATSGPDSWDSGLLGNGATYLSPVLSEGEHPYYCIPHGGPGGAGMAGTVFVLPPCNDLGEVMVTVTFDVTSNGTSGYEVLVDGTVAGTFTYAGGAAQSATVNVPGDNMNHVIEVRDIDDMACSATTDIVTADCNGGGNPMCMIDVAASLGGGCDENNQVPIDLTITASDQSTDFTVTVDGTDIGSYAYTGSTTNITINIDGDGLDHTIEVKDIADVTCTAATLINTPDCNLPCSITNLTATAAGSGGNGIIHTVNVEDFIFNPSVVNITVGDQVEWVWTGDVAHTATSDATSGPDSWDSGLLDNGATYLSPVLSEGEHPYYCIPHGSPGGVGMAGTIFVLPPCNDLGEVMVTVTFDVTSNGASGYEVLVDGTVAGTFTYAGGVAQSASINVPGDNMNHVIEVRDIDDMACSATTEIVTADCNGGGNPMCMIDVAAEVGGGCDENNQVPVDLTITASDQSTDFTVTVDGIGVGTFAYTGSTTNITIDIDGDGLDHVIEVTDNADTTCTATVLINTLDCSANCSISNIEISFSENTSHVIQVEDFEFIPDDISISLGDTIIFDWVGIIPHTATSDISTGTNAFDSGLLSQGATFSVVLSETGEHPYYCIPHGAPGGIGMAGNIFVQPPCDGENSIGNLTFNHEGSSGDGFIVTIDDVEIPESPIDFNPGGSINTVISVLGDSLEHILRISDLSNPGCSDSIVFMSPACLQDSCNVDFELTSISECDGANVLLEMDVNSDLIEAQINFYKDGVLLNESPLFTDEQGDISFENISIGNGANAVYSLIFPEFPDCSDTLSVTIPDCNVACVFSEVEIGEKGKHMIEVRDFDFFPADLEVLIGDTVQFIWTGDVEHTTTSDNSTGETSWNSGLLGNGEIFEIVINELGDHPYYCIPHGGPNGIGMSGSITAIDTCNGSDWLTNLTFNVTAGSPLGFNIFLDGEKINAIPIPYKNTSGQNQNIVALPGDGASHLFTIQDVETDFCAFTKNVKTGQCGPDCIIDDLEANVGISVIHEIEVRDFDFYPSNITVRVGETVRFIWTGDVPHTSTSDVNSGIDSWNSGLLSQGDTFDIVIQTIGEHGFYCIPHGGPGGIGQSGIIYALPGCLDGEQEIKVKFTAFGGSDEGYKLFVDGNLINDGLNQYQNTTGQNFISIFYPADGLEHIVTVQDAVNPICAASAFYESEDCNTDCEIEDLSYSIIKNRDTVLVRDFDFLPIDITVESGDTIFFDWVGDIPHTVTSDAIEGEAVFNSGLLQKGDGFILILDEIGNHPYYCIPHGSPGGIGMAGSITVVDPCDDKEVLTEFTFESNRISGAYNVLLNGNPTIQNRPYSGQARNNFRLSLPADQTAIEVSVVDQLDSDCMTSLSEDGINCDDPCFETKAKFEYDIDFATKEVRFIDKSEGAIESWEWDFGDGGFSTEQNPVHQFAEPIVYEVCLTASQNDGCSDTFCDKVRFSDEVCIAGFVYEQNDLELTFTNTSDYEDVDTEILWTFGDGDISTETSTTSHTYELGIYTVCIQISSDSCVASYCEDIDLSDPCLTISPDFEVIKDGEGLTVMFEDRTTGTPDLWLWGFGDGSTSNEQNPSYTYEEGGRYNICLFVQESENSCSKSYCKTIAVGTTSVNEIVSYRPLNIFPNPSSPNDIIYIEGISRDEIGEEAQVRIYDLEGRLVKSTKERLKEIHPISTEDLSGVFIIRITGSDFIYSGMCIKQ